MIFSLFCDTDIDYVAVKAPMFSFARLRGADPTLGVEMSSTGEVACFGRDVQEAFLQALLATTFCLPEKAPGKYILLSIAEDKMRTEFLESVEQLLAMGYQLAGTPGTADFYTDRGLKMTKLLKPGDKDPAASTGEPTPAVIDWIEKRVVDLVVNIPEGSTRREEVTSGYLIRRAAVDFGASLLTNIK